jgi:choice-of-anchor B domain-containing protein
VKTLFTLIPLCIAFSFAGRGQNITLLSHLNYPNDSLANIGGYVDTTGKEYALVGTTSGLDIVDVTNPSNPVSRFSVPGPHSEWREVKTYRKFAYVTTEGGGGLTIVDLTNLPANINYHHYTGDGAIANQLDAIHALHCDTAKGFLYLYGSDVANGGSVFLDLTDPWNPTYAGNFEYTPAPYVHDGFVLNDTMYECHIYGGFFTIVDVTDKSNPVLIATQETPTAFTHNSWLSDDHKTLFTTDENSGSYLTAFDISDPANIEEISRFQTAPGSGAIVHNTHILNDYAITSWYKEGVVITDVSRPWNPIEVGHYDTWPQGSGAGFEGCWGVYPFLPSGNIVASDIVNGLYVLAPTYQRGCYLEGTITDSITTAQLPGATVKITGNPHSDVSDANGYYATGILTPAAYDFTVTRPGYFPKTITGVALSTGLLTMVDVQLVPLPTYAYSGTITDSITAQPIANVTMTLQHNDLIYTGATNSSGVLNFPGIVPDTYDVLLAKWGYVTKCYSVTLSQSSSLSEVMSQGYYDDFSTDFGWTVSGSSSNAWERGEPIGSYNGNNDEINPEFDVTGDCGDQCFVTDNSVGPYNSHDVDGGYTNLYSPIFDGTIYINPVLSYYRRFLDVSGTGNPNDSMVISILNGTDSVNFEMIGPYDPTNGTWVQHSAPITGITLTSSMQVVIRVFDRNPGNIVEGAIDQFQITGQLNTSTTVIPQDADITVSPNPFTNQISISLSQTIYKKKPKVIIKDISGKTILTLSIDKPTIDLSFLSSGVYLLELETDTFRKVQKLLKN